MKQQPKPHVTAAEILELVRSKYPDVQIRTIRTQTLSRGTTVVTTEDRLDLQTLDSERANA